jgi:hypothetical protein
MVQKQKDMEHDAIQIERVMLWSEFEPAETGWRPGNPGKKSRVQASMQSKRQALQRPVIRSTCNSGQMPREC